MANIGSDVREITINNPITGAFTLFCKAGESSNFDKGGLRNTDDTGMVTGDGKMIHQKTMVRSKMECPPIAWDKTNRDELGRLSAIAESLEGSTCTFSFVDGSIYQMNDADIVGDIVGDGYAGTIPLIFQGEPGASKIS